MDARYLRVKNLDRFQHYSKRRPPWIKLYRTLITGEDGQLSDFLRLTEPEQWQLVRIWLLASQCDDGLMAFDERWMRVAIRSEKKISLEKFVRDGWLEVLSAEETDAIRASGLASESASTVLENGRDLGADVTPPEKTEVSEKEANASSKNIVDFPGSDIQVVYDHWRRARGKTRASYDRMSVGRRDKIKARLREFTVQDLLTAIDNVANDPWPDRPRHDDLTVLFRSRERVEAFLEMTPQAALAVVSGSPTAMRFGRGMTSAQIIAATRGLE